MVYLRKAWKTSTLVNIINTLRIYKVWISFVGQKQSSNQRAHLSHRKSHHRCPFPSRLIWQSSDVAPSRDRIMNWKETINNKRQTVPRGVSPEMDADHSLNVRDAICGQRGVDTWLRRYVTHVSASRFGDFRAGSATYWTIVRGEWFGIFARLIGPTPFTVWKFLHFL